MEKGSFVNGIGSMIMMCTMIWGIQTKIQNLLVQFLEALPNFRTLAGEEPAENQPNMVRRAALFNIISFNFSVRRKLK